MVTPQQEQRGRELFAAGATERQVAAELGIGNASAHRLKLRLGITPAPAAAPAPTVAPADELADLEAHYAQPAQDSGRRCTRCGTFYEAYLVARAFRRGTQSEVRMHANFTRAICRPCEQTARDDIKQDDRWKAKARDTIRRHAERLNIPKDDLIRRYGWDPARLAHEAEHAYGNGCSYCGHPYRDMGHGLSDITLDVQDNTQPYYRTQTKWCCQTCNRKKGTLRPADFEADRQIFEEWERQQEESAEARGMLFA